MRADRTFQPRRRDFLVAAAGAALAPIAARAQDAKRLPRIGFLHSHAEADPEGQRQLDAFLSALAQLGWRAGETAIFDIRYGAGEPALFRRYAAELVALGPDVILAGNTPALRELGALTQTIPLVFVFVVDPVAQGFVPELARPGGNMSGFSVYDPPMIGKWLQMLADVAPQTTRVAFIYNPQTAPYGPLLLRAAQDMAASFRLAVDAAVVKDEAELRTAIAAVGGSPGGALIISPDSFNSTRRDVITELAIAYRLPTICPFSFFPDSGALLSYGLDSVDINRRAAAYVDRVLLGARVGDLPIQGPALFELVINLTTARALGLTVPPSLLQLADRVIE